MKHSVAVRPALAVIVTLLLGSALPAEQPDILAANNALGRGVNFGNALEAPREGNWGMKLEAEFFEKIAAAGFNHVRVPIKWSAHAEQDSPHKIDPVFFARIDWVLAQAEKNKLRVVLDMHHYEELDKRPDASYRARARCGGRSPCAIRTAATGCTSS